MTEIESIEKARKIWGWMLENPTKDETETWLDLKIVAYTHLGLKEDLSACPFCEFTSQPVPEGKEHLAEADCSICPARNHWNTSGKVCEDYTNHRGPYMAWVDDDNIKPMVDMLDTLLAEYKQKGGEAVVDYWEANGIEKPQAVVVAAACKHTKSDLMCISARHWDKAMNMQWRNLRPIFHDITAWEDGFINQFGEFLTRSEAMKVVKASGQSFDSERNGGEGRILFSEGLY